MPIKASNQITISNVLDGQSAIAVILSNENHTFSANSSGQATATTISTDISAYAGTTKIATTVGSITGLPTGMTMTVNNNGKTNTTISIAVTTSLTTMSGSVNIPITANGTTITKTFSYTLSKTGATGSTGQNATAYWLVVSTAAISKSIAGVYNPSSITLTGKSKTGNSAVANYSGRFQIFLNGSTTATYTSSANEATKSYTIPANTTSVRCVMYAAGGTSTVLDEQTIPVVSDGKTGGNGVGVSSVIVEYYKSTSATSQTGGSWSTTSPAWENGKYIWSRNKTTLTNGTVTYSEPVCVTGGTGNTGSTGKGVASINAEYYLSTSKTTQSGGSWVTTSPTWSSGKYLWSRHKIVYSNPTSTVYTTPICDSSWEAVNEIQVGGRNLINGTNQTEITLGDYPTSNYSEGKKYNSNSILLDNEYVLSFDAKSTVSGDIIRCHFYDPNSITNVESSTGHIGTASDGHANVTLTDLWERYWIKYKQTPNADTKVKNVIVGRRFANAGTGSISIRAVKLESGNKPTDWTPAPEDVQEQIDNTIANVDVEYYLSTSSTAQSGGSWSTTAPTWVNGKYMWSRTKKTYGSGTVSTTTPVCIAGAQGSTGKGVASIVEQYYKSTSATSQSGGSWGTTYPGWENGKYIWTRSVITYTDNTSVTTNPVCVSGSKGTAGRGVSSIVEYYLASSSSSGVTTSTTGWATTIPTITTTNKYLWNYEVIQYTDNTSSDPTAPKIIGVYGNTGNAGKGIKSTAVTYQASSSGTTTPSGTWATAIPSVAANQFLWTRTVITYTDNTTSTSYSIGKMGATGATGNAGKGIASTAITYQASTSGTTVPTGTWGTSIPSVAANQFLWTRTVITYTDNTTSTSYAIGKMGATGATGATGNGISGITNYYLATASASGVTTSTSGWTTTVQTLTATNKYLWNYEVVTYTNGNSYTSTPVIIGAYGDKGQTGATGATGTGYTVILTNENHTFPATTSAAIAGSATTNIVTYKNTSQIASTISKIGTTSVSGNQTGVATGITGLTANVTNNGTTTATITFNATTALTTKSGTIAVTITADGKTFVKNFSFSLAITGATGGTGTAAKSVDITATSQVFKSTDGGLTFSPDTIKLTPVFQGGVAFSKWQYSINGGTSWVDVASGSNGLTVASGVLTIAKTCALYTDSITSISFKCISNNASYFDVMTVLKLYDVTDIEIGGRNLLRNTSYQNDITGTNNRGTYHTISRDTSTVYNNNYSLKIECNTKSVSGLNDVWQYTWDSLIVDKKIILSFYVKGSVDTTAWIRIAGGAASAGMITFNITTEWTRVVIDFGAVVASGTKGATELIYGFNTVGTYFINSMMLHYGNKPTDWTPAPEDIQEQIDTTKTTISEVRLTVDQSKGTIDQLIKDTTIVKISVDENNESHETTVSLKDEFNETKDTVSSHTTTIAQNEMKLDEVSGDIVDVSNKQVKMQADLDGISNTVQSTQNGITNLTQEVQDAKGWKYIAGVIGTLDKEDEYLSHTPAELNKQTVITIDLTGISVESNKLNRGAKTILDENGMRGYLKNGENIDAELMFEVNSNRVYTNRLSSYNGVDFIGGAKGVTRSRTKSDGTIVHSLEFVKTGGTS